jgi:hypothetical protein
MEFQGMDSNNMDEWMEFRGMDSNNTDGWMVQFVTTLANV